MTDEKRVVLIKPGDVLLIGGVRFSDAKQAAETMDRFKELTGITPVVLFADDIQLGQLTADILRELLARAGAKARGGVFCADEAEMDAALDAIPPADAPKRDVGECPSMECERGSCAGCDGLSAGRGDNPCSCTCHTAKETDRDR